MPYVVTSRIVFSNGSELDVHGDPEKVMENLRNGWAQLNHASASEENPDWYWVNAGQVLYVYDVSEHEPLGG